MSKQEFLERLRQALNDRVAPNVVTENVDYYEDYINVEIRKGKSEEEVLAQLGDPRLIARTIAETSGGSQTQDGGRNIDSGRRNVDSGRSSSEGYFERGTDRNMNSYGRGFRIPGWVILIVLLVVVVLVVSFVLSVVSAVLPVLLPILVVVFLVKLFRDWMN